MTSPVFLKRHRCYVISGLLSLTLVGITSQTWAISPEAYSHYKQAVMREKLGDFNAAEQEFRLAIALDPTDNLSLIHLAALVTKNSRFDEALMLYQSAFDINPRDRMLHLNMGHLYELKNDPYQALSHYMMLLENTTNPYPYAYLPVARIQTKLNDKSRAIESYQAFLKTYPNHPGALSELAALGVAVQVQPQIQAQPMPVQQQPVFQPQQPSPFATLPPMVYWPQRPAPQELLPLPSAPSDPTDEAAAREALKQGRYDDAIAAYNASIGTNPSAKYPLYLNIADIANTMGRPDKIEEALSQYQKFEPNNPRVLLGLGDLASQRKDYKSATQSYARALMTAKEPVMQRDIRKHFGYACQMLGDYAQAAALYKEVLREEPQAKDIQKNLAITYQQDGKLAEALAQYRAFVPSEPQESSLRQDMGNVLMSIGNQAIIERNPVSAKQYFEEARNVSQQLKAQAEKAIAQLKANAPQAVAATSFPSTPASQTTQNPYAYQPDEPELRPLASSLTPTAKLPTLGTEPVIKPTSPSTSTQIASAVTPSITAHVDSKTLLSEAKNLLVAKNFDAVISKLEKLPQASYESHLLLAQAHEGLNENAQAAQSLENALALKPSDIDTTFKLGQLYRQTNDLDKAQAAFEQVKAARPKDHEVYYDLGVTQQMQGKADEAIASFKQSTKNNSTWPDAYYGLGVAYEGKRNFPDAITAYESYLKLVKPEDPVAASLKKHVGLLHNYVIMSNSKATNAKPAATTTP